MQNKQDEVLKDFIEIKLNKGSDFLRVMETLTRIGVPATYSPTLWQTCHIFQKRNKFYIVHFKEMLKLDGILEDEITEEDLQDRDFIIHFLQKINLIKVISKFNPKRKHPDKLKIIKSADKKNWILDVKYTFGKK